MTRLPALFVAAALLHPLEGRAQATSECFSFSLPGYQTNEQVFPSVRLERNGRASLSRATGEATWTVVGDSVRVASGFGYQGWTLTLSKGTDDAAILRRWEDDPHSSPEPPISFRAAAIACESVQWPSSNVEYDAPPRLSNNEEVDGALRRRNGGQFGVRRSAKVMFLVDELGKVTDIRLEQSAGVAELDEAALRIGEVARFTPASLARRPVAAWTALWFRFR